MMTRNVTLTLEKAREWFNSGNAELKEIDFKHLQKRN